MLVPHAPAPLRLPPRPLPRWRACPLPCSAACAFPSSLQSLLHPDASARHTRAASRALPSEPCPSLSETPADPSYPPARAGIVLGSAAAGVRAVVRQRRGTPPPAPASRRCWVGRLLLPPPGCSSQLPARRMQACSGMGQQTSKEDRRLQEIRHLLSKADETLPIITAATEAAAGIPAAPGSAQARYDAAFDNYSRLTDEQTAIVKRKSELCPAQLAAAGSTASVAAWAASPFGACRHQHLAQAELCPGACMRSDRRALTSPPGRSCFGVHLSCCRCAERGPLPANAQAPSPLQPAASSRARRQAAPTG